MTPATVTLPSKQACIARAADIFAAACRERDELFARSGRGQEGALAVGRAAWPGDEERAARAAATYLRLAGEDAAARAAGTTSAA